MARPMKNRLERLDRLTGESLLRLMRDGLPCFNANGDPVLDEQGRQVHKVPPAAFFHAAMKYLELHGWHRQQSPGQGDEHTDLLNQVGEATGFKLRGGVDAG